MLVSYTLGLEEFLLLGDIAEVGGHEAEPEGGELLVDVVDRGIVVGHHCHGRPGISDRRGDNVEDRLCLSSSRRAVDD